MQSRTPFQCLLIILLLFLSSTHSALLRRNSNYNPEPTSIQEADQLDEKELLQSDNQINNIEAEAGETIIADGKQQEEKDDEDNESKPESSVSNDAFESLDTETSLETDGSMPEPDTFAVQAPQPEDSTGGIAALGLGLASTGATGMTGSPSTGGTGTTGITGGNTGSTGATGGSIDSSSATGLDLNMEEIEKEASKEQLLQENIKALMNGSPRVQVAFQKFQKAAAKARQLLDAIKKDVTTEAQVEASDQRSGSAMTGETGSSTGTSATEGTGATGSTGGTEVGSKIRRSSDRSPLSVKQSQLAKRLQDSSGM